MDEMKRWRPRSIIAPLILIVIGLTLLLENMGILHLNVWDLLWRLWPVLLIGVGLELLLGRRTQWGSLIVAVIVIAILGGSVALWNTTGGPIGYGELTSDAISQPLGNAARAQVEIGTAVGRLTLQGGSDPSLLVSGTINRLTGETISNKAHNIDNTLVYQLRSNFTPSGPFFSNRSGQGSWDLLLNHQIPMDLTIHTGVGQSQMDFSGLNLTSLTIDSGVGESTVTVPAAGRLNATIHCGVGRMIIRVPRSMGANIQVHTGIGNVSVYGDFQRNGNSYRSANYGTGANQIDLNVDGGIGQVEIRQVD